MAVSVKATLTLDTAQFSKALKGALTTANLVSSAIVGAFNKITGGFSALAKGIFDAASEMEQFKFSFEALLGSAEKAQKKMAEVAAFSNSTRFDLKDVAEASRNLEILTRGALSGEKGLRLIGDTAAGLQKPFQDVAYAVGELFDTLSKGGDAASELENLRQMGAITQKGAGQIGALSKGGPQEAAKAWKLATIELEKYKGKAASQSETWEGVTSRFGNALQNAFRTVGMPLIKALEPALKQITQKLLGMAPIFEKWGDKLGSVITSALDNADEFFSHPDKMLNAFGEKLGSVLLGAAKSFSKALASSLWEALKASIDSAVDLSKNSFKTTENVVETGFSKSISGWKKAFGWTDSATAKFSGDGKSKVSEYSDPFGALPSSSRKDTTSWGGLKNLGDLVKKLPPVTVTGTEPKYGKRAFGGQLFGEMGYNFGADGSVTGRTNISTKNDAFFGRGKSMLDLVESAHRAAGVGGFANAFKSQSTLGVGGNAFGGSLALDAKRTTSLLSFGERRKFDMARRAGIAAANGGRRAEGDTLVRRGDRARARAIMKEQLRDKTDAEKQTAIQIQILALFKKFAE